VRLPVNFFQPGEKLVTKQRPGARVHRVFDRPQTPYQRLGAAGVWSSMKRAELETLYQRLTPLRLRRDLEGALDRLWTLAAPDPHRAQRETAIATPSAEPPSCGSSVMPSVTLTSELTTTGG